MEVVCLTAADCALLAARYAEHGNSSRMMRRALEEANAPTVIERIQTLRSLEHRHDVDLGEVCHRYERRNRFDTHPIERLIMNYIAQVRLNAQGGEELWIRLDRVREVRSLMGEGKLVGEPGT